MDAQEYLNKGYGYHSDGYYAMTFARQLAEKSAECERLMASLEEVIKERDLAQARLRVCRESRTAGMKAELNYVKENWPK